MKLKKTTAALLVAGLTIAGSSYAWADELIFNTEDDQTNTSAELTTTAETEPVVTIEPTKVDSDETSKDDDSTSTEEKTEDTKVESDENVNVVKSEEKEESTKETKDNDASENVFPEIPEGYTAGNLVALKQAYENAGSENAKQAILKNAQRAIEKFNAKNGFKEVQDKEVSVEIELVGVKKSGQSIIEPVTSETLKVTEQPTVVPSTKTTTKVEKQISTKDQQKADKKAHQQKQKADKKELHEQQKAEKKALKEKHKNEK